MCQFTSDTRNPNSTIFRAFHWGKRPNEQTSVKSARTLDTFILKTHAGNYVWEMRYAYTLCHTCRTEKYPKRLPTVSNPIMVVHDRWLRRPRYFSVRGGIVVRIIIHMYMYICTCTYIREISYYMNSYIYIIRVHSQPLRLVFSVREPAIIHPLLSSIICIRNIILSCWRFTRTI